jgi:hypothetical protein
MPPGRVELPRLVPAHRDHPVCAQLRGGEHTRQADRAIPDYGHGHAGSNTGGHGGVPSGGHHIGEGQQAGDELLRRLAGGRHEGPVGLRNADQLRLTSVVAATVEAVALKAGPADGAGVVGVPEPADHELTRLNAADGVTNLLDDAAILVPNGAGLGDLIDTTVGPQIRPADADTDGPHDRIGWLENRRVGPLLVAHITRSFQNRSSHRQSPP